MQAGACSLLNRLVLCGVVEGTRYKQNSEAISKQSNVTNDLKFASSRELVWTLLNPSQPGKSSVDPFEPPTMSLCDGISGLLLFSSFSKVFSNVSPS